MRCPQMWQAQLRFTASARLYVRRRLETAGVALPPQVHYSQWGYGRAITTSAQPKSARKLANRQQEATQPAESAGGHRPKYACRRAATTCMTSEILPETADAHRQAVCAHAGCISVRRTTQAATGTLLRLLLGALSAFSRTSSAETSVLTTSKPSDLLSIVDALCNSADHGAACASVTEARNNAPDTRSPQVHLQAARRRREHR